MIRTQPARPPRTCVIVVLMLAGCVSAPVTSSTPECVAFRAALGRYMDATTDWAEAFVAAAQQRRPTAESARTYELMSDARRMVANAEHRADRRGCPACPAWAEAERAWVTGGKLASRLPQNYESAMAYFEWHLEAAVRAWRACGEGGPPVRAQQSRATCSSTTAAGPPAARGRSGVVEQPSGRAPILPLRDSAGRLRSRPPRIFWMNS